MLDHISIQCADVRASAAFYDAVLGPLGGDPGGNNVEAVCHTAE